MQESPVITPQNFPSLLKRFQSLIIDQLVIISCMVVFYMILGNSEGSHDYVGGFLLFMLFFAYEPFCMSFGCSVGNYITGIRVRQFDDETQRISLFNAYIRFTVKVMLGIISFFTVTSDSHKRAIHDKAAGSIMLNAKK